MGLLYTFVAMLLPSARDIYKKQIDVKIKCWTNILDVGKLTWRQRDHAFNELSVLYYEQYILDNVPDYEGTYPYLFDLNVTDEVQDLSWMDLDH